MDFAQDICDWGTRIPARVFLIEFKRKLVDDEHFLSALILYSSFFVKKISKEHMIFSSGSIIVNFVLILKED